MSALIANMFMHPNETTPKDIYYKIHIFVGVLLQYLAFVKLGFQILTTLKSFNNGHFYFILFSYFNICAVNIKKVEPEL